MEIIPTRRRHTGLEMFVAVVVFIFGVIALIIGSRSVGEWLSAQSWATTTGEITRSELTSEREMVGDDYRTTYEIHIRYSYTVDGRPYTSDRIWFVNQQIGRRRSLDVVEKYPVGAQVEVTYNPEDPSKAVLETSLGPILSMGGLGVLFMALGILVGVRAYRKRRG